MNVFLFCGIALTALCGSAIAVELWRTITKRWRERCSGRCLMAGYRLSPKNGELLDEVGRALTAVRHGGGTVRHDSDASGPYLEVIEGEGSEAEQSQRRPRELVVIEELADIAARQQERSKQLAPIQARLAARRNGTGRHRGA